MKMKKFLLVITIALIAMYANAQSQKVEAVPPPISDAFTKLYPTIKTVKWEIENGKFEANFQVNKVETSATFDPAGNFLESESEIKVSELPKKASDYVAKTYPKAKIKEASRITDAKGVITYEAAWKGVEVIFDDKGTFIKEHKEHASN
jgi:hypothetical protein